MSFDDLKRLERDTPGPAPLMPAVKVRVVQAPGAPGDPLVAVLVYGDDRGEVPHTVEQWAARLTLPAVGSEGLAVFDDASEPWIVQWAS